MSGLRYLLKGGDEEMGWNMTLFTWAVILVSILTGGDPVCPILDGVWQIKEGGDSPTSLELKSQGNRTNPTKNRKPVLLQPVRTISSPDPSSSPWFSTVWPIILSSTWAEITNRRTPHKLKHYSICQFVVFWISLSHSSSSRSKIPTDMIKLRRLKINTNTPT